MRMGLAEPEVVEVVFVFVCPPCVVIFVFVFVFALLTAYCSSYYIILTCYCELELEPDGRLPYDNARSHKPKFKINLKIIIFLLLFIYTN